jgi:hypothetical protein
VGVVAGVVIDVVVYGAQTGPGPRQGKYWDGHGGKEGLVVGGAQGRPGPNPGIGLDGHGGKRGAVVDGVQRGPGPNIVLELDGHGGKRGADVDVDVGLVIGPVQLVLMFALGHM